MQLHAPRFCCWLLAAVVFLAAAAATCNCCCWLPLAAVGFRQLLDQRRRLLQSLLAAGCWFCRSQAGRLLLVAADCLCGWLLMHRSLAADLALLKLPVLLAKVLPLLAPGAAACTSAVLLTTLQLQQTRRRGRSNVCSNSRRTAAHNDRHSFGPTHSTDLPEKRRHSVGLKCRNTRCLSSAVFDNKCWCNRGPWSPSRRQTFSAQVALICDCVKEKRRNLEKQIAISPRHSA